MEFVSLQINGVVLHKMCHLNASVSIKGIPGTTVEFIVLRKDTALDIMAVKAVTNFPAAFDQLDHLHSCYKNVRTVSIQKVSSQWSFSWHSKVSLAFVTVVVLLWANKSYHISMSWDWNWKKQRCLFNIQIKKIVPRSDRIKSWNYDHWRKALGIGPRNFHFRYSRRFKRRQSKSQYGVRLKLSEPVLIFKLKSIKPHLHRPDYWLERWF